MNYVIKIETTIKNVKSKDSNFSKSWSELNQIRKWSKTESSQRMIKNWIKSENDQKLNLIIIKTSETIKSSFELNDNAKEKKSISSNKSELSFALLKKTNTNNLIRNKTFLNTKNKKQKKNKKSLQKNMSKKKNHDRWEKIEKHWYRYFSTLFNICFHTSYTNNKNVINNIDTIKFRIRDFSNMNAMSIYVIEKKLKMKLILCFIIRFSHSTSSIDLTINIQQWTVAELDL